MMIKTTTETLKKRSNMLNCLIPDCGRPEAHRIENSRLCTIHHRQYMDLQYLINLVELESKAELLIEIMVMYELKLRE